MRHRTTLSLLHTETGGDDSIRVWVLGCSSGQEAYSIAIAIVVGTHFS